MDNLPLNTYNSKKFLSKALTELVNPNLRLPSYKAIIDR
jgi:hypothetical protein